MKRKALTLVVLALCLCGIVFGLAGCGGLIADTTTDVPTTGTPRPPFEDKTEEELEEMFDLFDYETPLWGALLQTGDDIPAYPFVFGGIGLAALLALALLNRRKKTD